MPIISMRFPQYFVVGPQALNEAGYHAAHFGKRALIIGGKRGVGSARESLLSSLENKGVTYHIEQGDHVSKTLSSVNNLVQVGQTEAAELLIACGGGTVMDCGKAVAHDLQVPYIAVPTTVGVNACGTNSASIIDDPGPRRRWYQAVDVIIADTSVIARSGGRFLASGMGDALPTGFATKLAIWRNDPNITAIRAELGQLCTDLILTHGTRAYRACQRGHSTPEVERVVEAIIFCGGTFGMGMGGDHVLHPANIQRCKKQVIHGEWVAFGLLVRLVLGGEFNDEIPQLLEFYREVNLPTCFSDFGLTDATEEEILSEAKRIVGPADAADYGVGRLVSAQDVCEAMFEVDSLGRGPVKLLA